MAIFPANQARSVILTCPTFDFEETCGRFVLRVDPQLHKALAIHSLKEGKSLNAYVAEKLSEVV